jgi:hypothetical protein
MKRMYKLFALLCVFAITFSACSDDDDVIEPVDYEVTVKFDESLDEKVAENVNLTLTSTTSGKKYEITTKSDGVGMFVGIVPDTYNLSASLVLSKEEFSTLFGYDSGQDESTFNAVADNLTINNASTLTNELTLLTSRIGDLLFKQIYYVGSDTKEGAVFRDVFFEIYNNSNEIIYADGLYFATTMGNVKNTVEDYTLDNKQFDWSKSIGQTMGDKSNSDYVYVDHIFQIPGGGTDYPMEPGQSIVIAGTAINHKTPLVVGDKEYSVQDPSLTIDLSNATFEVNLIEYLESVGRSPYATDIDNPDVPNMNVTYNAFMRELIPDTNGKDGFIIFRSDDIESYPKLPTPDVTAVTEDTRLQIQIPNSVIIDGVETNYVDDSKLYPRQLSTATDGGYAFVPKGAYSSQSLIRKVVKEVGGRKILQDSNNSTNDFEVLDLPVPFGWKQ